MDETAKLKLPYIMPSQAQKHVTHNEALRALDAIVHISVVDRDRNQPPANPAESQRHLVGPDPVEAFEGHAGEIAAFQDGAWAFYAPQRGWLAWDEQAAVLAAFDGIAWVRPVSLQSLPLVGINATADATNRLACASAATLLTHEGGGHQLKINKAAAAETGSLLFQTEWSGRAEMGLAGNDDFSVKVSADGANWKEAIAVDGNTGAVSVARFGIGTEAPASELHLHSTRTTGLDPHMLVRAGKPAGGAASVAYQRASPSQQMLVAFETGSSSNPDGYVGTMPGKTGAIYVLADKGAGSNAALGIDDNAGLRIGTASDIVSGSVGASITPAGQAYFAAGLSIGTVTPDSSALLELASTARGFLPPRMTTAERDAIANPATGLMVYNITDGQPQFWNGGGWVGMG